MRILFPTDFSDASRAVFPFLSSFADNQGLPIHLLHVYPPPSAATGYEEAGFDMVSDKVIMELEKSCQRQMDEFLPALRAIHDPAMGLQGEVRMGTVSDEIVRASEETPTAFIATAVKESSKLDRLIFGTSVNRTIKRSAVPVLTIPQKSSVRKISKMAYATDLGLRDRKVIEHCLKLADSLQAQLDVFHVHDSNLDTERNILDEFRLDFSDAIEKGRLNLQLIESLDVEEGMMQYIDENEVDLLVMLRQKDYWLDLLFNPSHTRKMTLQSHIPVLIYHE
jgi:nucleotide-binding universal stress UspA family protein